MGIFCNYEPYYERGLHGCSESSTGGFFGTLQEWIYDYLPFASSDFSLNSFQFAHALIFNKVLAEDANFQDKYGKSMYEIISDGEWTFDLF